MLHYWEQKYGKKGCNSQRGIIYSSVSLWSQSPFIYPVNAILTVKINFNKRKIICISIYSINLI